MRLLRAQFPDEACREGDGELRVMRPVILSDDVRQTVNVFLAEEQIGQRGVLGRLLLALQRQAIRDGVESPQDG